MSVSSVSSTPVATPTLSKLGNGEYTAASVSADPKDAIAQGLSKQADGNYGTANAAAAAGPAARSAPAVQDALNTLKLGG